MTRREVHYVLNAYDPRTGDKFPMSVHGRYVEARAAWGAWKPRRGWWPRIERVSIKAAS